MWPLLNPGLHKAWLGKRWNELSQALTATKVSDSLIAGTQVFEQRETMYPGTCILAHLLKLLQVSLLHLCPGKIPVQPVGAPLGFQVPFPPNSPLIQGLQTFSCKKRASCVLRIGLDCLVESREKTHHLTICMRTGAEIHQAHDLVSEECSRPQGKQGSCEELDHGKCHTGRRVL